MTSDPRPDAAGHFGRFGGRFMPEALIAPLDELEAHWREAMADDGVHVASSTGC